MKRSLKAGFLTVCMTALATAPIVTITTLATADAAYAKGGNGNGNAGGNGNGGGNSNAGGNGHGKDKSASARSSGGQGKVKGQGQTRSASKGGPKTLKGLFQKLTGAIAGLSANSGYSGASGYAEAASYDDPVDRGALLAVLPVAAERAQGTFDRFLVGATLRTKTSPDAAVKVHQGETDVWLFEVSRTETGFVGYPAGGKTAVSFQRAEVTDWSYATTDGRMHGNFGARAMMGVLPPHRAALMASTLSLDPLPKGW